RHGRARHACRNWQRKLDDAKGLHFVISRRVPFEDGLSAVPDRYKPSTPSRVRRIIAGRSQGVNHRGAVPHLDRALQLAGKEFTERTAASDVPGDEGLVIPLAALVTASKPPAVGRIRF